MNGDTCYKLVRDIMEKKNMERNLKDEVSEDANKIQKAYGPSFEM
jgi:hypothetical protein